MMKTMTTSKILLLVAAASFAAYAGDGVIEINQAKALAGGVTPGDTAGFPVTISEPGSYRLTSNLSVSDAAGTEILSDNVTLDLNGFAIQGPVVCTGSPIVTSCEPAGTGTGVQASGQRGVTVKNGTVQGMGGFGVSVNGRVENVRVIGNRLSGISAGVGAVVDCEVIGNREGGIQLLRGTIKGNVVTGNGVVGIAITLVSASSTVEGNSVSRSGAHGITAAGGVVRGNAVAQNTGDGIRCVSAACVIESNTSEANEGAGIGVTGLAIVSSNIVTDNLGLGISLSTNSAFSNNQINGNGGGTVAGGIQTGINICDGAPCP